MTTQTQLLRSAGRGLTYGIGAAAGVYAAYVAGTWLRYGRAQPATGDDQDPPLDRFMPAYEIAERHHVHVAAPAAITLAAACDVDLQQSAVVRAIFKGRELILGSDPGQPGHPRGLVPFVKGLGWASSMKSPGVSSFSERSRSRGKPMWCFVRCHLTRLPHSTIRIRHVMLKRVKADAERRARLISPADRFDLVSAGDLDPQC
jgi:hypothetical protein